MHYAQLYKSKQFFFVLIKLGIVSLAFYFIYTKLTQNSNSIFSYFSSKNTGFELKNIIFLLFLSLLNWFFEILKWKTLVSSIKKISFKSALEQCLGSLTTSLITPNRIGEYGAKALYYTANYRNQIMLINLIGNLLQLSVTLVLGCLGLLFFTSKYYLNLDYKNLISTLLLTLGIFVFISYIVQKSDYKIKGVSFQKIKLFILGFPKKTLLISLFLSGVRYALFSFQFYYLLLIFKIDISYLNAMEVITSMYLLASIIPAISIFDVLIKGSVAIFLFSFLRLNELTILHITTLIWMLNFALPSIIGSYFVLRFTLPKRDSQ